MKHAGFELEIDRDRDILTLRYLGTLTFDVAHRALAACFSDPSVTASTLVLLDTTSAHVHEVDVDWLRRFQAHKDAAGYPSQITALVVSRYEGNQLLGQLWAAMRTMKSPESVGVFTDAKAATEWLLERRVTPISASMSA
jgi:hypothetical protein